MLHFLQIGPIEKECVNTLLSEVLCLPPSLCRPLSTVVHSKTGGIILFILRFLASLNDDGDLSFSMTNRRWTYDLEQVRLKEIHDDVVTHMTEVCLLDYPPHVYCATSISLAYTRLHPSLGYYCST